MVTVTGVNIAGDAGDTSPPIYWLGGRQREYPHQYYYVRSETNISRPRTMTAFSDVFYSLFGRKSKIATESTQTPLRDLTQKALNLAPPGGGGVPSGEGKTPTPHFFGASSPPKFELALTPLVTVFIKY